MGPRVLLFGDIDGLNFRAWLEELLERIKGGVGENGGSGVEEPWRAVPVGYQAGCIVVWSLDEVEGVIVSRLVCMGVWFPGVVMGA